MSDSLHKIFAAAAVAAAMTPALPATAQGTTAANPLPTSYYARESQLANGHWARIRVTAEGIHQITYNQLRELGFSDPSRVKVCGYGGAALTHDTFRLEDADDVAPTYSMHTDDGRLLFYGVPDLQVRIKGWYYSQYDPDIRRNYYSTSGYYLLTDKDIESNFRTSRLSAEISNYIDNHLHIDYVEDEVNVPQYQVNNVPYDMRTAVMHAGRVENGSAPYPVTFKIRDYDNSYELPAQMMLSGAIGWTRSGGNRTIDVWGMDGFEIVAAPGSSRDLTMTFAMQANTYAYSNGKGWYNLKPAEEGIADGDYTARVGFYSDMEANDVFYQAFDNGWVIYPRKNILTGDNGGLLMNITSAELTSGIRVSNASPATCVWDVTDTYSVYPYETSYDAASGTVTVTPGTAYNVSSQGRGCGRLIAFDPTAPQLPVETAGDIENQNLHGITEADMIIVTADHLYEAACELARIHEEYDGSKVVVCRQQQIFNEFSSGTPDAMAIRRLVKMVYDRAPERLKGVLMYGTSTSDNRHILRTPVSERLLIYEVLPVGSGMESATRFPETHFGTDNYYGMVDGNFDPTRMYRALMKVPVTRLPVSDAGVGHKVNEKIRNYLSNKSFAMYPRVLLTADDGDNNSHFADSWEMGEKMMEVNPSLCRINAQLSLYPRPDKKATGATSQIFSAMDAGVGFFNYCGHGKEDSFTDKNLLDLAKIKTMSNRMLPVAMISSCFTNMYDTEGSASITQEMVLHPTGGMIAAIGASRSVFQNLNQTFNIAVGRAYAGATAGLTVGSLYMNAVNSIITTSNTSSTDNLRLNTLCYGMVGDPLVPLPAPDYSVRVLTIGDTDVAGTGAVAELTPMTRVRISGDLSGADAAGFNGKIELRLYDGAQSVSTIDEPGQQYPDYPYDKEQDFHLLTTTVAEVTDGKWEAELFVPNSTFASLTNKDTANGDTRTTNRLILTAEGTVGGNEANALGSTDRLRVLDVANNDFTATAPVIEEFYLDSPDFVQGSLVGSDVTVYAKVRLGDAGLSTSDVLGNSGRLVLDGGSRTFNGAASAFVIGTDGTASLTFPVSEIESGRHTMTLSVRDNAGQAATASLAFISAPDDAQPVLAVSNEIVRDNVDFDLTGELVEATADNTRADIYIHDDRGETVFKAEDVSFPYQWNLRDNSGNAVSDGRYTARALLRLGTVYTRASAGFTVIK